MDVLLDLIELLHNEIVAEPIFVDREHTSDIEGFDKATGQEKFRHHMNRVLELADPPLELLPIGHIVERNSEHRDLYEQPLPEGTEDALADPVKAAMGQFLRPGASIEDKRAAVKHLVDVLERIRPDVKREMLNKDEGALFDLANNFALRHYGRDQKGDYDKDIWLDWAFHIYLATIRAVLAVLKRQETEAEAEDAA